MQKGQQSSQEAAEVDLLSMLKRADLQVAWKGFLQHGNITFNEPPQSHDGVFSLAHVQAPLHHRLCPNTEGDLSSIDTFPNLHSEFNMSNTNNCTRHYNNYTHQRHHHNYHSFVASLMNISVRWSVFLCLSCGVSVESLRRLVAFSWKEVLCIFVIRSLQNAHWYSNSQSGLLPQKCYF